jgi:hypothetical protein
VSFVEAPVIQHPAILSADAAWLHEDDDMVGVIQNGWARAYLIRAFAPASRCVVNDEVAGVPMTVCYCPRTDRAQVFTSLDTSQPLDLAMGGYVGQYDLGSMLLRLGPWRYRLDTATPLEKDAPPFPYTPVASERARWKEWRTAHPDTDVYVGFPPSLPTGRGSGNGQPAMPPVRRPRIWPAGTAGVPDDAEVIGVSAGGRSRAYLVRAFAPIHGHVVNDQLGAVPVTVSFCGIAECAQVFTGSGKEGPLEVGVAGFHGEYDWGSMVLRVGAWHYQQKTGVPMEQDAPPFPYARLAFQRTTWKQWRAAHPDTDVYLAPPPPPATATSRAGP